MEEKQELLNVCAVQMDIVAADIAANIEYLDRTITTGEADLWVLPETFATGFASTSPHLSQKDGGEVLDFLIRKSRECHTAICGSVIVEEGSRRFNRFYLVDETGRIQHYDKRHLFSYGGEGRHITGGTERQLWELKGWKIMPIVCYDLRFPVWSRNDTDYDLLLCVANWPDSRIAAWDALLKARAIENMAYLVGVNRIGIDALGSVHTGHSVIYTPLGKALDYSENTETILRATLNASRIENIRSKYGFLADRDTFDIEK
ncbi:MAG: nitrilase family protein [Flavobacteriales bacterium]|nr:nitrilase family protein [Flavobacteriales bacterium]